MENIILLGNFMYCPRSNGTIISNDCQQCEYIFERGPNLVCVYDEADQPDEWHIKDVIMILLGLMEKGKTRINAEELMSILSDEE